MSIITRIAAFFFDSKGREDDRRFRDAAETYRQIYERVKPLTNRTLEINEFSPSWLDATELVKHQEAIRELTASINLLRDLLEKAHRSDEKKLKLYSAACEMYRNTLIGYAQAGALSNLSAARQQFNLFQKKSNASLESPAAEAVVQMEIDALDKISKVAEAIQQEAKSLELDLDSSLIYAKLAFKSGR